MKKTKLIIWVGGLTLVIVFATYYSLILSNTPDESGLNAGSLDNMTDNSILKPAYIPEGWEGYSNEEWEVAFAYPLSFSLVELPNPLNTEYTQNILIESGEYRMLLGRGDRGLPDGAKEISSRYKVDELFVRVWQREVEGKYEETIRIESTPETRPIFITTTYDLEPAFIQQFLSTLVLQ